MAVVCRLALTVMHSAAALLCHLPEWEDLQMTHLESLTSYPSQAPAAADLVRSAVVSLPRSPGERQLNAVGTQESTNRHLSSTHGWVLIFPSLCSSHLSSQPWPVSRPFQVGRLAPCRSASPDRFQLFLLEYSQGIGRWLARTDAPEIAF